MGGSCKAAEEDIWGGGDSWVAVLGPEVRISAAGEDIWEIALPGAWEAAPAYMLATWGWVEWGQVASCLVIRYLPRPGIAVLIGI